ncbi:MAG: hypothetical protein BHV69_06640 [Bacteroidales bacterium 52_46]|nr:MAG: hypothetical protein BHV69_06640 [Bacteroidales bacterium 52_46]
MRCFKNIAYCIANIFHWVCTIIGALVIVGLLTWLLRSCYDNHKPESVLYGNWSKVDTCDMCSNQILTFDWNGKYYDSNTGSEAWNYQFIEPDSLILYHHALYEERCKILNLTEDTLTIRLSESIVNLSENGKDIEAPYGDCLKPIYTYIRINHSTIPIEYEIW